MYAHMCVSRVLFQKVKEHRRVVVSNSSTMQSYGNAPKVRRKKTPISGQSTTNRLQIDSQSTGHKKKKVCLMFLTHLLDVFNHEFKPLRSQGAPCLYSLYSLYSFYSIYSFYSLYSPSCSSSLFFSSFISSCCW